MPSSSVGQDNGVATAAVMPSRPAFDDRLVSSLRTQHRVDALCKEHGVPKVFTARPAGALLANATPPPGAICVYARALEAGMRVPLHGFFCEVLVHFGIAPAQLMPNGWRVMAGFLALCRSAGVPPSLAVFRRFFVLSMFCHKLKGWYYFRARDRSGLRFTGMPYTPMDWKKSFFFLSSPEPWPCPVEWGEPSKNSFVEPVLIGEEKKSEAKLLDAYGGGAAVDISTCLCDGNLAGATVTAASRQPPTPPASSSSTCIPSSSRGMDPSVYNMMKTMRAARASTKKVKAEPGSNGPGSSALCGNKRSLEEANDKEGPPPSLLKLNTARYSGVCSPPPGFSRKPQHLPSSRHGRERDTKEWKAARELLHGAIAPPQERAFAASEPSDVVKSSYGVILQAVNYTSFSLSYALGLEEKLVARDAEVAALQEQLEDAKAELAVLKWVAVAEAKRQKTNVDLAAPTTEAELEKAEQESAEAAAGLQHLLGSEENVWRCAENALEEYELWRDDPSAHVEASATAASTPTDLPMMHPSGRLKRRAEPSTKYDPEQWVL